MDSAIDYQHLEKPAVMRKHTSVSSNTVSSHVPPTMKTGLSGGHSDLDYLDIPAFLRRKEEVDA
jgi:cell division protein FtsZ